MIILDDDMQVVPPFVECHRRHHPPGSRVCVLGSVPIDGPSPLAARYVQAKFNEHLTTLADPDHHYVSRDFYTGNVSLRSEVLRTVCGFDESAKGRTAVLLVRTHPEVFPALQLAAPLDNSRPWLACVLSCSQ